MTDAGYDQDEPQLERFRIGRVFGRTFSVIGRNLPLFLGLSILLYGLPLVALDLIGLFPAVVPGTATQPVQVTEQGYYVSLIPSSGNLFALVVAGPLLQAALARATVEHLGGRRPRFADCLRTALAVFLPVVAISVIVWLGTIVGLVLLIVPGVILWLGWVAAVPVKVQEGLGVFASLSRSRRLAKGSKWRLFWLFLALCLAIIPIQAITQYALGFAAAAFPEIATVVMVPCYQTIATVVVTTAWAASYVELRQTREGSSLEELAAIFA